MRMKHEYGDNQVTAWGGMQEMKILIYKTGISKKIAELGLNEWKQSYTTATEKYNTASPTTRNLPLAKG